MKPITTSELSREQIARVLRTKDEYKKVEFAGEEREIYIGGLSFELAEEEGVDLGEVFQVLDKEALPEGASPSGDQVDQVFTALTWLLYVGMKPFGVELSPAEIKLHLATMSETEQAVLIDNIGMAEAAEAMEDAVGNAPAGAEQQSPPSSPDPDSANGVTASDATTGASSASPS